MKFVPDNPFTTRMNIGQKQECMQASIFTYV